MQPSNSFPLIRYYSVYSELEVTVAGLLNEQYKGEDLFITVAVAAERSAARRRDGPAGLRPLGPSLRRRGTHSLPLSLSPPMSGILFDIPALAPHYYYIHSVSYSNIRISFVFTGGSNLHGEVPVRVVDRRQLVHHGPHVLQPAQQDLADDGLVLGKQTCFDFKSNIRFFTGRVRCGLSTSYF